MTNAVCIFISGCHYWHPGRLILISGTTIPISQFLSRTQFMGCFWILSSAEWKCPLTPGATIRQTQTLFQHFVSYGDNSISFCQKRKKSKIWFQRAGAQPSSPKACWSVGMNAGLKVNCYQMFILSSLLIKSNYQPPAMNGPTYGSRLFTELWSKYTTW